jgi:hypothetical protein
MHGSVMITAPRMVMNRSEDAASHITVRRVPVPNKECLLVACCSSLLPPLRFNSHSLRFRYAFYHTYIYIVIELHRYRTRSSTRMG